MSSLAGSHSAVLAPFGAQEAVMLCELLNFLQEPTIFNSNSSPTPVFGPPLGYEWFLRFERVAKRKRQHDRDTLGPQSLNPQLWPFTHKVRRHPIYASCVFALNKKKSFKWVWIPLFGSLILLSPHRVPPHGCFPNSRRLQTTFTHFAKSLLVSSSHQHSP